MTLAQLLAAHPAVLLDFDGPVCAVFGGELSAPEVAHRLFDDVVRQHGVHLPDDARDSGDPFDVLRAAARSHVVNLSAVESALRHAEVRAVATAPTAPGLLTALNALHSTGHSITIVSNNSAAAVHAFLDAHSLGDLITRIVARVEPDPALLKPSPHLVTRAIDAARSTPADCVLIGDSITDILAARAAGTAAIAYANKPGKRVALAAHHPDAVICALVEIVRATDRPAVS